MKYPIAFIDTEIEPKSRQILDIGGVRSDGCEFHKKSFSEFVSFLSGTQFVCGHNILNHDIKYIGSALQDAGINPADVIDTLPLSPLLFPTKPYHALLKDDKLQTDEVNNPLNDSVKARCLFHDEIAAFQRKDDLLKQIFFGLLGDTPEFQAFFRFISSPRTRRNSSPIPIRNSSISCRKAPFAAVSILSKNSLNSEKSHCTLDIITVSAFLFS